MIKFNKKEEFCGCIGMNGIEYDEHITVYNDEYYIGSILFSGTITRFADGESNYDYSVSDLRRIIEKMEGKANEQE